MGVIPVVKFLKIVLVVLIFQFFSPPVYPETKDLRFDQITVKDSFESIP